MNDFEKITIDNDVTIDKINDAISIKIGEAKKLAFVDYSEGMLEIIKQARFRVPDSPEKYEEYKYPYSNEYKKYLHQIAFDYQFGEDTRKKAYELGYIIEHLDNEKYNCQISNLFLLKKVKNIYKGWNFDKVSKKAIPIVAMKIFHVTDNQTFQITIGFNEAYTNKATGKQLSKVRLLYPYNYEIVLQDAEQIIEAIAERKNINFDYWKDIYRFKDIRIEYAPDIELTEEEKKQKAGTLIMRDGQYYLLVGMTDESVGLITSIPSEKDWNIE